MVPTVLLLGLVKATQFTDPADVEIIDGGRPYGDVFKLSATLQDHMVGEHVCV